MQAFSETPCHVLFLSSWYPNRLNPLAGNFIQNHARAMAKKVKVSVVVAIAQKDLKTTYLSECKEAEGVTEVRVYFQPSSSRVLQFLRRQWALRKGIQQIKKEKGDYDFVHAHVIRYVGLYALFLRCFHQKKYLLTEHWSQLNTQNARKQHELKKKLWAIITRKAAYVCPVSQDLARSMQSIGLRGNYQVIPNVIDTSCFQLPEQKKSNESCTFLHLSNFAKIKNVEGILQAIAHLNKKGISFSFQLGGDATPERFQEIKERAAHLGLGENLYFFGSCRPEQVAAKMQQADALVLFSQNETQGCVILESLACGTPVLATSVGGIPEILPQEAGVLIPEGDSLALAQQMEAFSQKKYEYSAEALSRYAHLRFGEESISHQFMALYKTLLSSEKA